MTHRGLKRSKHPKFKGWEAIDLYELLSKDNANFFIDDDESLKKATRDYKAKLHLKLSIMSMIIVYTPISAILFYLN